MSDSAIYLETPCEHGEMERHKVDPAVAYYDKPTGRLQRWCDGGSRRVLWETQPDYEAAAKAIADSLGEKLHDGHDTEGPCLGCHSDAERFVELALAGRRIVEETE